MTEGLTRTQIRLMAIERELKHPPEDDQVKSGLEKCRDFLKGEKAATWMVEHRCNSIADKLTMTRFFASGGEDILEKAYELARQVQAIKICERIQSLSEVNYQECLRRTDSVAVDVPSVEVFGAWGGIDSDSHYRAGVTIRFLHEFDNGILVGAEMAYEGTEGLHRWRVASALFGYQLPWVAFLAEWNPVGIEWNDPGAADGASMGVSLKTLIGDRELTYGPQFALSAGYDWDVSKGSALPGVGAYVQVGLVMPFDCLFGNCYGK